MTAPAGRRTPRRAPIDIPEPDPERLQLATALAEKAPEPARAANVLCGTAGWTDRTLIQSGRFYPSGVSSARDRLAHYAAHFAMVEVDATYYSLLPAETAERWVETTPEGFRFDVKAFPVVTGHPIDVGRLPADLKQALQAQGHERRVYPERMPSEIKTEIEQRFAALLEPLIKSGKLGSVLAQFPPWFTATRGNVQRIEAVAERWSGVPLAVEFRHGSWLAPDRRERVLDLLRRLGLSYVCVDEPELESAVPPLVVVTHPALAVVRFHGKNLAGWQKKGATVHQRFDWLYTPEELSAWVAPVKKLASEAREVHAVFNNCVRNYAVLNAKGLAVLLEPSSP